VGRGVAAAARISDLRVEGQTAALEAYIAQQLRFPPLQSNRPF
jgi:hypothetical protein